jgi:hypothetical protein
MNSSLGFGVVGFGTLFGLSAQISTGHGLVRIGLFVLLIPIYSLLVMGYWLGELRRAQRAFAFTGVISARINAHYGKKLLIWEDFIHQNIFANGTSVGYVMTCSVFIFMSLSGIYYGSALCLTGVPTSPLKIIAIPLDALRLFPAITISFFIIFLSIVIAGLQMGQILYLHMNIEKIRGYYINTEANNILHNDNT